MSNIKLINTKLKKYAISQGYIDFFTYLIITIGTVLLSTTIALLLLKSPIYGLIGVIPILFYRRKKLIEWAREIEKEVNLNGELVSSIQLSQIPGDCKERYSRELIDAYIDNAVDKIRTIDFRRYISYRNIRIALLFLLIVFVISLIHPTFFPAHFWYSLNHKIAYSVTPEKGRFLKGTEINLTLSLFGPHLPEKINLITTIDNRLLKETVHTSKGIARKRLTINEPITYYFEFFEHKTDRFKLSTIEPIYIENISFHLHYPLYTKLKDETKNTKQLIVPQGTKVFMDGKASQPLNSARLEFTDTINLKCDGDQFSGEFTIKEGGTAIIHLIAENDAKEPITIYSIPDLSPLVDIFYPGYNINLPTDMKLTIGIRCSDDYGLENVVFYYNFKNENRQSLKLKKGVLEDTIYFDWDLSQLSMLPGDEVLYFALIRDNSGHTTKSKTFYVYFPTMEEMYQEVHEKENLIQSDLRDLQTKHIEEIENIKRVEQKIMKERELSWLDKEKLKEVIGKEEKILEKIDAWKTELERTIEKLNEGIILDQKSIERLQEITKILQEIAPDELRQALENLKLDLNKSPEEIQRALENLKQAQEELAKALERTLEILKRYQQEERLKELAEMAKELAEKAHEIDSLMEQFKDFNANDEMTKLNKDIEELANELYKLAKSDGLEQEIKEALKNFSQQAKGMEISSEDQLKQSKKDLTMLAEDLQRLYESMVRDRSANLRKNLLETLNQLIDISETQEDLYKEKKTDSELQDGIIDATRTVVDSLYGQQIKSLYVTPAMGKGLAKAIKEMEKAKANYGLGQSADENVLEAMRQINLVCLQILENLKRAGEGGSSTGMDKFLQSLSEITQGQMALNQSMFSIFPLPISGLTPAQMSQLRRLAARQRDLRQALEALRDSPGAGRYQELLDNLANEMKETEEALYQYKLDRKLIERQRMIISRLLDTEKSIRKEDYSKERKSRPGKDIMRLSPGQLPTELGEDELREIIQRALKEPYPREYELYIREYFKRLLEKRLEEK